MSSIANSIVAAAQAAGIDPRLAMEVANAESGMNQSARGRGGEIGVFQLMPSSFPGVDPTDVNQNIQEGIGYLAAMLAKYQDPAAALAAYNWGPTNMDNTIARYGTGWFIHIPASTQGYVNRILGNVQTQYSAAVGPIPVPASFVNMPAVSAAPAAAGMSLWTTVAIAVGVIFGISLLISEG